MASVDDEFKNDSEVFVVGANKEAPKDEIEIDIDIVDDTPEEDKGRAPLKVEEKEEAHEDELDKFSEGVQKRMNQLTHRYHDERRAKEALERQNQEAIAIAQTILQENERLKTTLDWGQKRLIDEAAAKVQYAEKFAEDRYRKAYESGDTEGVLEAQKALQEVAMQKMALNEYNTPVVQQNTLQNRQEPVYNAPYVEPERPQAPQRDQKAEEWAAKNPWFGADEEMTSLAYGLHSKLVRSGIDPTSEEYYGTIDKRIRDVFPDYFGKQKPRASSPVAPAGRSTAGKKMTLTATQVALAKKLGVSLDNYAKHAAKLGQ